jgi:hypothetical protein
MKLLKRSELKPGVEYRPVDSGGEPLIGTLETVPGVAGVNSVRIENGLLAIDYDGETSMQWNDQVTKYRRGQAIWIDAAGQEVLQNAVRYIEQT